MSDIKWLIKSINAVLVILISLNVNANQQIELQSSPVHPWFDYHVYFELIAQDPYFKGRDSGSLILHTPVEMEVFFTTESPFKITARFTKEEFEYISKFDQVLFEYPDWLLKSPILHFSVLDIGLLLEQKLRHEEKLKKQKIESEKPINRLKSFFGMED